jgi:hypothetical protein
MPIAKDRVRINGNVDRHVDAAIEWIVANTELNRNDVVRFALVKMLEPLLPATSDDLFSYGEYVAQVNEDRSYDTELPGDTATQQVVNGDEGTSVSPNQLLMSTCVINGAGTEFSEGYELGRQVANKTLETVYGDGYSAAMESVKSQLIGLMKALTNEAQELDATQHLAQAPIQKGGDAMD